MKKLFQWFKKEAPHLRTGRLGELQAEQFLKKSGLKIIARNVRVGHDELDLIARQGDTLIFVEVKTRAREEFGRAVLAVNAAKRRKLSRAAIRFLKRRKLRPPYIRFDIIEVIGDQPEIRHIPNAFTLEGGYRIWW
ncbi:MAG: putative endonuclease [Verrucomicrobiota bacterium]|jgi:putative endonuclease|nr:putative endonuclease [Verrucomicrobiota bacterium]